jgi:polar amino acid transport system substrate-binding protein
MGWGRLAAIGLCLGLALAPAAAQEQRTIRIATEGAFPPFNYLDNNEPQGLRSNSGGRSAPP